MRSESMKPYQRQFIEFALSKQVIHQRLGIKTAQQSQIAPGVKQAGVKEIGALTPGFLVD
jgi:hypothetical protein